MRILVLGAGAIGGYFGGLMARAGVDVTFLVRPGRVAQLKATGLRIEGPDLAVSVPVRVADDVDGAYDAVLLTCKAFDLDAAIESIAPAVGPQSIVVPLLNGLRHLDVLDARFGRDRVAGGVALIGATLAQDGTIRQLLPGAALQTGARTTAMRERIERLHHELSRGGFDAELSDDIEQLMWNKFVFLTSYAAITTLMRAPIGTIVATDDGEALVRGVYAECEATARAVGHAVDDRTQTANLAFLTRRGSRGSASMLRDLQAGKPTEHAHIVGDMLARARAAGLQAPTLQVAHANLQAYELERTRSDQRG